MDGKKFRIKVDIDSVELTELKDVVKFFDPKSGQVIDFKDLKKASTLSNVKVILFNVFMALDDSLPEDETV